MYRNEAFTESLYIDVSNTDLDSLFGMAEIKKQLKQTADSIVSDELSRTLEIPASKIIMLNSSERNDALYYAHALCGDLAKRSFSTIMLTPQSFLTGGYADFERKLTKALNEVIISSPCAVICSDAEMFCSRGDSLEEKLRTRLFTDLLNELSQSGAEYIFIAVTSDANKADPDFISMLNEKIDIPTPDEETRKAYIMEKLKCVNCTAEAAEFLAKQSDGCGFTRINKRCEQAKLSVYKHMIANANGDIAKASQNAKRGEAVLTIELVQNSTQATNSPLRP